MTMYPCHICKKEFKTTQHLEQHKNRKKMCTLSNLHLNKIVSLPNKTASDDLNIAEIMSFIKTAEGIQSLLNDKKIIEDYKNIISNLTEENTMLKNQLHLINKVIKNSTETAVVIKNKKKTEKKTDNDELMISPLTEVSFESNNSNDNVDDNTYMFQDDDNDTTCNY